MTDDGTIVQWITREDLVEARTRAEGHGPALRDREQLLIIDYALELHDALAARVTGAGRTR